MGKGATNPEEEGGAGGPRLYTGMLAECVKSRWGGWGAERLLCLALGSESPAVTQRCLRPPLLPEEPVRS